MISNEAIFIASLLQPGLLLLALVTVVIAVRYWRDPVLVVLGVMSTTFLVYLADNIGCGILCQLP